MADTVTVDGTVYEYEAEACAGVMLTTTSIRRPNEPDDDAANRQWFGTRVKFRPAGRRGRWSTRVLVDVHPFAFALIEAGIRSAVKTDAGEE